MGYNKIFYILDLTDSKNLIQPIYISSNGEEFTEFSLDIFYEIRKKYEDILFIGFDLKMFIKKILLIDQSSPYHISSRGIGIRFFDLKLSTYVLQLPESIKTIDTLSYFLEKYSLPEIYQEIIDISNNLAE